MQEQSLWSAVTILCAALLIIILEHRFPYTPGQRLFREGWWTDGVAYTLIQSYVLGLLIAWFIEICGPLSPWTTGHFFARFPLVVQCLFFLVTHDLYIYWFHRWQHHNKWLWRIHEAHHSATEVDWLSGSRSHPLEILINQSIEFLPIALLGASAEVFVIKTTIDSVWGMYIHSNIDVRSGSLQRVINGPEMHRWHHSAGKESHHTNFSTKLAIWDWIFGTAFLPTDQKPKSYGLRSRKFPQSYLAQIVYAFRRRAR